MKGVTKQFFYLELDSRYFRFEELPVCCRTRFGLPFVFQYIGHFLEY